MDSFFRQKRVLVTGACGTVGRELVRQLSEIGELGELICIDNNESELFFLEQRFGNLCCGHFFLACQMVSAVCTPNFFASSFFARMMPCLFSGFPQTAMGTLFSSGLSMLSTEAK